MSLARIRNRIEALERRFALTLSVVRLRPVAEKICHDWAAAMGRNETPPEPHATIKRIVDNGFRLPTFTALFNYLQRSRDENKCPRPRNMVQVLLPGAVVRGIVYAAFQWDPAAA